MFRGSTCWAKPNPNATYQDSCPPTPGVLHRGRGKARVHALGVGVPEQHAVAPPSQKLYLAHFIPGYGLRPIALFCELPTLTGEQANDGA